MKAIEKAIIRKLNDNMMTENQPIVSLSLEFEDSSIGGTPGYRHSGYHNFLNNIMEILEIKEKSEIEGKNISVLCTSIYGNPIALGNKNKWLNLKDVGTLIETDDIIKYIEEQEKDDSICER